MGRPKSKVARVRVVGPLEPFAAGFQEWMTQAGYTPLSAVVQLRFVGQLSRWLAERGLGVADLTAERVAEFKPLQSAAGHRSPRSRRSLVPLLNYLSESGVLPPPLSSPRSTAEQLLASFHRYLLTERGLVPSTAAAYVVRTRRFLAGCAVDGNIAAVTTADVTSAILAESRRVSVGSTQFFVASVRSFLRFCYLEGILGEDLSAAALGVTGRRRSPLPLGVSRADTDALLHACDRRRALGRRDFAVLLVLLRLGLRAGEVASLTLEDINWRSGEVMVHGKARRDERLPLPSDVGAAIVAYLRRGRPTRSACREVFLSGHAPIGPLTRGGVSLVVRRAAQRAGLGPLGTHRLRHTVACQMIAAGAGLPEIGQVLRHRSRVSTANYARVDVEQLRTLAQPWPGGGPR